MNILDPYFAFSDPSQQEYWDTSLQPHEGKSLGSHLTLVGMDMGGSQFFLWYLARVEPN